MDFVPLDIYMLQQMCGALNQNYECARKFRFTSAKMSLLAICVMTSYSPFLFFIFTFVNIIVYLYCSSSLVFFRSRLGTDRV